MVHSLRPNVLSAACGQAHRAATHGRGTHVLVSDEIDLAQRELEADIGQMAIPNGYSNDQFSIRDDLDLVRTRVQRRREVLGAA